VNLKIIRQFPLTGTDQYCARSPFNGCSFNAVNPSSLGPTAISSAPKINRRRLAWSERIPLVGPVWKKALRPLCWKVLIIAAKRALNVHALLSGEVDANHVKRSWVLYENA